MTRNDLTNVKISKLLFTKLISTPLLFDYFSTINCVKLHYVKYLYLGIINGSHLYDYHSKFQLLIRLLTALLYS